MHATVAFLAMGRSYLPTEETHDGVPKSWNRPRSGPRSVGGPRARGSDNSGCEKHRTVQHSNLRELPIPSS